MTGTGRPRSALWPLAVLVAAAGVLAAAASLAVAWARLDAEQNETRAYQARTTQEGLAELYRDLGMIGHLLDGSSRRRPNAAALDYVDARRDQLDAVRWLGVLASAADRPKMLVAPLELRGYDPRHDPAVATLLETPMAGGLAAAARTGQRDGATLALVMGPVESGHATLVALVDGNRLLGDNLFTLPHLAAPLELRLGEHRVGSWPDPPTATATATATAIPTETRSIAMGMVDFTLAFAAPGRGVLARSLLPQPLILLAAALVVAALVAAAARRAARPPSVPPPPVAVTVAGSMPPAASRDLHRIRLWQLGELAASVSHDLGQPLNVIRLTAEAAQDAIAHGRLDAARLDRTLACAVDQALRAQAIMDAVVAAARRPALPPAHLRPVALVRRVLADELGTLKDHGIRLLWHADLSAAPVLGHPHRLEAAVRHLLTNAREALADRHLMDGRQPTLWVECRPEGDWVAITVADNGPGFPAALRAMLDDPAAAPERGKGCGLGLAVILGVASEMGGRLEIVDAAPGTRARLILPVARRSLLVVDDDDATTRALAEYLDARGWRVRVAHSGNQALDLFRTEAADAVITDLNMADGDGWDLIARLHGLVPDLPILAASTEGGDSARRAVAAGAALVLRKPLGLKEICDELEALLGCGE